MATPPWVEDRSVSEQPGELREFMLVLRQALLMIVAYIERRYRLERR